MLRKLTVAAICGAFAMLAVTSGAGAAKQATKVAKGHTRQGRTIRVAVQPNRVRFKNFSIKLRCSGGYVLVDQESGFLPTRLGSSGRFNDVQFGSTDEVRFSGRLTRKAVTGKIRVRDKLGKHKCSSPWVKFNARR